MPVFKYCGLQKQLRYSHTNLLIWRGISQDGNKLNAQRASVFFGLSSLSVICRM